MCSHANLASAFVILNYYEPDAKQVEFNTLGGKDAEELVYRVCKNSGMKNPHDF